MKIAYLSHLDLNLYLFRLPIMKELVNMDNEVFAICPEGEFFEKFYDFKITPISYKIKRESLNPFNEISTIQTIKKILKDINPDILHTFMHKPNIYGNFSGAKNIINTVTGLGSFFIHNDLKSKIVRLVIENLYKYSTKNAKKIIFQNSDDLNYFVSRGIIPEEKAILIKSSGVDTHFFQPQPKNEKLLEELNIEPSKLVVLMIARVIRDKGVLEYIEAAETLKDKATFLYVGDIDKGNKNTFNPNFKNVKYLGFRKDIKDIISIADIVVLPSYREGTPRTLLEAGAMGKPLITTNAPGCKEVVKDGYNGFLVRVKDSKILAEKIKILIEDENLRKKFGDNSREYIKKEFDVKIVVKKYLELYNDILKAENLKVEG